MSPHAWFRLGVRLVGLMLVGLALPELSNGLSAVVYWFDAGGGAPGAQPWLWQSIWVIGPALQGAFGVYLLTGGRALVRWCMQDIDSTCTRCGYPLAGAVGACPECGLALIPPHGGPVPTESTKTAS